MSIHVSTQIYTICKKGAAEGEGAKESLRVEVRSISRWSGFVEGIWRDEVTKPSKIVIPTVLVAEAVDSS